MKDSQDAFFPTRRFRRLRQNRSTLQALTETRLCPEDFLFPLFVQDLSEDPIPVESLPGMVCWPLAALPEIAASVYEAGIPGVLVFPRTNPDLKTSDGREALNPEGLIPRAVRLLKQSVPNLLVITDVALDPYTDHGHDGILTSDGSAVANDATVEILTKMACLQAEAGVDWVAPSDMMDGRVGAIRKALDADSFQNVSILAYSAKFASAFYGPFRDAVGSRKSAQAQPLDKKGYQLNPANRREALRDALADVSEGADLIMIKPAGPYLDIIRDLRELTNVPLVAYQVSGEYAQLHAAAEKGWLDLKACRDESLLAIKRAGADLIISYFAHDLARELRRA